MLPFTGPEASVQLEKDVSSDLYSAWNVMPRLR